MSGKGTQRPHWPSSGAHHRQKAENQLPVSETELKGEASGWPISKPRSKLSKNQQKRLEQLEMSDSNQLVCKTSSGESDRMDGTQQRRNSSDRESDDKLATWDPMKDAYESPVFNSYENKTALEMSQDPRTLDWIKRDKNPDAESQNLSSQRGNFPTRDAYQLFVRNIPCGMTQEGVTKLFSKSGSPSSVKLLAPQQQSASTRAGFVRFMSAHEADTAIRDFDGFWLPNGQKLKVSLSRDSPKLGQLAQFPMQSGRQKNDDSSTFLTPSDQVITTSNEKATAQKPTNVGDQSNANPSGKARAVGKGHEVSKAEVLVADSPLGADDLEHAMGMKSRDRNIKTGDCGQLRVTSVVDACTVKGSLVMEGVRVSEELFRLDGLIVSQETQHDRGGVMLLDRLTVGKKLTAIVTGQATDRAFLVKVEDKQSQKNINNIVGGSRFVCRSEMKIEQLGLLPPTKPNDLASQLAQTAYVVHPRKYKVTHVDYVKFPEGRLFDAVISEIVNPTFYIQVAEGDSGSMMTDLSHQLTHHCMHIAKPTNKMPSKNEIVCACYPVDRCWYRARVLQIVGDKALEVAFVDYGNRATVQLLDVRDIPLEFLQLPAQALQCLLMNFKGTLPDSRFTDKAVEFVKSLKNVKGECVPGSVKPHIQFVKLFDVSSQQNPVSVGDKMVEIGLALRVHKHQPTLSHSGPSVLQPVGFGRGSRWPVAVNTARLGLQGRQYSSQPPALPIGPISRVKVQHVHCPTSLGDKFDIIVTHIASPTLFWAQLADQPSIESLCELMEKMAVDCNASPEVASFQPEIGAVCCARYSVDNGWYRATINAISGQKINVKFIDFGNDEIVARNKIQQINEDYLQLPVQAVKLGLFGGAGLQLRDMTERFRKLCLDKKLEATVREQLETYLLVDLSDLSVTPPLSIITELQKGGKVITVPFTEAAQSVCRTSDPESSLCNREPQCLMADAMDSVLPPHTQTFDIVVTDFQSPSCFYGQIADAEKMKRFVAFSNKLNEYYTQHPTPPYIPAHGELCCAFFRDDQSFYRAETEWVVSHNEVDIRYIDYGNAARLKASDIHRIDAQFVSMPRQAVCFRLAGITSPSGEWSQEALKLCQEVTVNQKKTCQVCSSKCGRVEVELFDSPECDTLSLNQQLVNQRLALHSTPEKGPQVYQPASLKRPVPSQAPLFHLDGFAKSNLPSLQKFAALVTVVDSPESFYIQVVDPPVISELADLTQSMTDHYSGIRQRPFIPVTGTVCAGRFSEDGKWYRVHLMEVDLEKRIASVSYPDFGNKETIPLSSLAVLVDAFRDLPLQAIHCCLAGVEILRTEAVEFMKVKVMSKQVLVQHDPECAEEEPHPVDIIDPESGALLSSMLIEQGIAKSTGGLCVQPLKKKVERYYLSEVGQAIIPADGFFTLIVTTVDDPGCFWGQVVSNDTAEQLNELSVNLTEHCQNQIGEGKSFHPEKGELCCARFSEDGMWYRSAVENVEDDGTFTVRFVDFGNAECVTANEVTPIPRSFLSLPLIAIQCQLAGVKSKSSVVWPSDATNGFKLLVEGRKLVAKQINIYSTLYSVELYDTSTEVDVFINKELVAVGLADPLTSLS